MVIIPAADYGLVERVTANTPTGPITVDQAEAQAIRRAQEICSAEGITEYTTFSDSEAARTKLGDSRVRWCSRWDGHLAGKLLSRITGRSAYLRRTEGRARMAETEAQREIRLCSEADRWEFQLGRSAMWIEIMKKTPKRGR